MFRDCLLALFLQGRLQLSLCIKPLRHAFHLNGPDSNDLKIVYNVYITYCVHFFVHSKTNSKFFKNFSDFAELSMGTIIPTSQIQRKQLEFQNSIALFRIDIYTRKFGQTN